MTTETTIQWHPLLAPYATRLAELGWTFRSNRFIRDGWCLMTETPAGRYAALDPTPHEDGVVLSIEPSEPGGHPTNALVSSIEQFLTLSEINSTATSGANK